MRERKVGKCSLSNTTNRVKTKWEKIIYDEGRKKGIVDALFLPVNSFVHKEEKVQVI